MRHWSNERLEAIPHLHRRRICKCKTQDVFCTSISGVKYVSYPRSEQLRLARSRPSDDHDRPFDSVDCYPLFRVEHVQYLLKCALIFLVCFCHFCYLIFEPLR